MMPSPARQEGSNRDGGTGWNDGVREAHAEASRGNLRDGVPEVKKGLDFQIGEMEDDGEDDEDGEWYEDEYEGE